MNWSVPPEPKPTTLSKWLSDVDAFSHSSEGTRNSQLVNLALRGRSLELSNKLASGETAIKLIQASRMNGYLDDESYERVVTQISYMKSVADINHVDVSKGQGHKPQVLTTLVPPSCTTWITQRFADDVYRSRLPESAKRQLYVATAIQRAHPSWMCLVMSARATSVAASVSKRLVGDNWRRAEKLGFLGFNPGVDYETAKALGVDAKSSEITLNLDIYPAEPVEYALVDLDDYKERVAALRGYIKYQHRKVIRDKQTYLKKEDISTCNRADVASIEMLKALLRGEDPFNA